MYMIYLDPCEKYSHSHHIVELGLPKAQRIKVGILLVVFQECLQQLVDSQCAVDIEHNGHISKEDDNDVQDIPEALEVLQLVFLDLQDFFNGVVDNEEDKNSFACHHEVVHGGDVTDEFHSPEVK